MLNISCNLKLSNKISVSNSVSKLRAMILFIFVLASILTINCVSNINEIANLEESPIGDQPTLGQHISQLAIDNGNVELDLLIEHGSWLKIPELFHV